jgi:type IV secretion system protein VirB10
MSGPAVTPAPGDDAPEKRGPAAPEDAPAAVAGERGISSVNRPHSLQSRLANVLAIGLLLALGVGLLGWYYARLMSTPRAAAAPAAAASGDAPLPPLGPIAPAGEGRGVAPALLGPAPAEPPPDDVPDAWREPATDPPPAAAGPAVKTPEELAWERRLAGPAHAPLASAGGGAALEPGGLRVTDGAPGVASTVSSAPAGAALDGLLAPSVLPAAAARVLPTRRLLLGKGAFVDCTLETAIDSTLPGMTTCVTATDTFGVDGSTVLLERGTKLIGETRGQVRAGQARVFVLWAEARTPTGVVIPLASPGTDALGRSGVAGEVDRHFVERFGAAILVSVIDGAVQRAAQGGRDQAVIVNPSTSGDVMTEVLKSTLDIPPTVRVRHGERVQVLVARDLDFRSVYELRPVGR